MSNRTVLLALALLAAASRGAAQPTQTLPPLRTVSESFGLPPPPPPAAAPAVTPVSYPTPPDAFAPGEPFDPTLEPAAPWYDALTGPPRGVVPECAWVRFDFLGWFTKAADIQPLVTAGPGTQAVGVAGRVGQPGTQLLFGGGRMLNEFRAGARLEVGGWWDDEGTIGASGRFFVVGSLSQQLQGGSDGRSALAIPVVNPAALSPPVTYVGYPNVFQGTVTADVGTNFWGADGVFRRAVRADPRFRLDLLAGYRYLHLGEDVSVGFDQASSAALPENRTRLMGFDSVRTRNHFNGGVVGFEGGTRFPSNKRGCITLDLLATVALGSTYTVQDATVTRAAGVGLVTLPTVQVGTQQSASNYAWVPEVGAKVGYEPWSFIRFTAGYDLVYWSRVRRPQSQPGLSPFGLVPQTDFWAQGFSLGCDLRW